MSGAKGDIQIRTNSPRSELGARTRAVISMSPPGCPKTPIYYLTVGLPIRGQPPGLRNVRDTRGDRVTLRGDVWTALVDVHFAGPNGWSKSQYAWLFKRDDSGRPVLESTILVGVVE